MAMAWRRRTMKQKHHQHQLGGQGQGNNNANTISLVRLFLIGAVVYPIIVFVLVNHIPLPSLNNHESIQLLRNQEKRTLLHGSINGNTQSQQAADNKHFNEGASACLLVNDENPRLPEWIAYHYNTLPLRSLTVAVDPASRSSPLGILQRWNDTGLMEMQLWNDDDYLYETTADDGTTKERITVNKDLNGHRTRQNHFITKCMADFKRRNKQWVILIDVDEYITFNRIDASSEHEEPDYPLEEAPDGIPTLIDWTWYRGEGGGNIHGWMINNTSAHPYEINTASLVSQLQVQPGGVVTDSIGNAYFLRDDQAIRDSTALDRPPDPMPTLQYVKDYDDEICGMIYGDLYDDNEDEEEVCIEVDDETPGDGLKTSGANVIHGGHVVEDIKHRRYFLEKEQALWPKRLALKDAREARGRLPRVDERKTILDVLKEESDRYGDETMGPCVMMPRLRYGSFEGQPGATTSESSMAPDEINANDFATLRYRWHERKGTYNYGKTMIDVRRIPMKELQWEADNVHAPLLHFCPRQVWFYNPQYVTSLFRVNHYLDSFEAYSYRNDVRVDLRRSVDQYNTLARGANYSMDTEGSPWLQEFFQHVGSENAKKLLVGAGSFHRLLE